jgi:hypothetical protein
MSFGHYHRKDKYISFEVAKLAKEKGFNPEGTDYYRHDEAMLYLTSIKKHHNRGAFHVAAVEKEELAEWLTDKHGIIIPATDDGLYVALQLLK